MARPKKIEIENKKLDLVSTVLEETLPAWESNGWTRVDDGVSDKGPEKVPASKVFAVKTDDPADPDADKE